MDRAEWSLRHFLDKFKQWHFHSPSYEVICLKKISNYMQGLKSVILAIFQTGLGWLCPVSLALKNPSVDFKNYFCLKGLILLEFNWVKKQCVTCKDLVSFELAKKHLKINTLSSKNVSLFLFKGGLISKVFHWLKFQKKEHLFFRWIVLRRVIWHLFFGDLSLSKKLSEIKPPLVGLCIL